MEECVVPQSDDSLLTVRDLWIGSDASGLELVRGVSIDLEPRGSVGIVGESGSGKSLTCRAILGILPRGISRTAGSIVFAGEETARYGERDWRPLRGKRIAAVFQDPASYLNPSIPVGRQLAESLRIVGGLGRHEAERRAVELLGSMGLRRPEFVYTRYRHELSGGMLQRVLIAIAVGNEPDLLIADEATTALDVTVQAEVLDLVQDLRERRGLALLIVSHDLAVVAQVADHVLVLRDGHVVESGASRSVLAAPRHEYTRLLLRDHEEYGLDRFHEARRASA
jgi:peptide/nickel transport system ATP-binding protein